MLVEPGEGGCGFQIFLGRAGALAAVGVSIILFTLASGLGLAGANPWSSVPQALVTFTIGAGIWLIVMQWLSSALGGYLAGRLRKKWVGVRTDEVFFRDTAHGLLAWALATAIVALLFTLGAAAVAGSAAVATDAQMSAEATEQARKAAASFFRSDLSFPDDRRVHRLRRRSARRPPPRWILASSGKRRSGPVPSAPP